MISEKELVEAKRALETLCLTGEVRYPAGHEVVLRGKLPPMTSYVPHRRSHPIDPMNRRRPHDRMLTMGRKIRRWIGATGGTHKEAQKCFGLSTKEVVNALGYWQRWLLEGRCDCGQLAVDIVENRKRVCLNCAPKPRKQKGATP
jgi:hypothetical protein